MKNCCVLAGSIVALKLKLPVGPKMPVPMLVSYCVAQHFGRSQFYPCRKFASSATERLF